VTSASLIKQAAFAAGPLVALRRVSDMRAQQRDSLRRVGILEAIAKDTPGAPQRYTAFLEAF
jgi:hypothetical protein